MGSVPPAAFLNVPKFVLVPSRLVALSIWPRIPIDATDTVHRLLSEALMVGFPVPPLLAEPYVS